MRCAAAALLVTLVACHPPAKNEDGDGGGGGSALCGDGVVAGQETCDPASSCPIACDDGDACTADRLVGSASACNAFCDHPTVTACVAGDGCCPPQCAADADCVGPRIAPEFVDAYDLDDLGAVPGLPPRYGGITFLPDDPDHLLIGGNANTAEGALYLVELERNGGGHITGFAGTASHFARAEYNDGGVAYGPGGVLFMVRWPVNGLGQLKPASLMEDKITELEPMSVAHAAAGLAFVPHGFMGEGEMKLTCYPGGEWYHVAFTADASGTYDVASIELRTTLPSDAGPEGLAYVPIGSVMFDAPSILVSEWSANRVSTYAVDSHGDPTVSTRRDFVIDLQGAEGGVIDPRTGDFIFSTFDFSGADRLIVVQGFAIPD